LRIIIDDKYRVIGKLGETGTSQVFHAINLATETDVAVKMMKETAISGYIEDLIRFKREIGIVSRLDHANIAKVFDGGESNGIPYFVMEYLKGPSLSEYLLQNGTMEIRESIMIFKQIAVALNYVHGAG
jgi:serine/threonine protein kinase